MAVKTRRLTQKQVDKVLVEYDLDGKLTALMEQLGPYAYLAPESKGKL